MPSPAEQVEDDRAFISRIVKGVLDGLAPASPLKEALKNLERDPHMWSKRACSTCHAMTSALGYPFGCYNTEVRRF